jgi:hypothetical protein
MLRVVLLNIKLKMKKLSIVKAITAFILLFSTSATRAQTPHMEPVPATALGQKFEIVQDDPLWEPLWEVSHESKALGQADLDAGNDPCNKPSCDKGVCCQTVHWYSFECGCWYFMTTCWRQSDGSTLLKVPMQTQ